MRALAGWLLWTLASSALLLAVFGGLVLALFFLGQATGSIDPAAGLENRLMTTTYFRVVFFKGLLPQLLLALVLWPLVGARLAGPVASARRETGALALVAALAYALVMPLLLSAEQPGWPALQMRSVGQHLSTAVLCGVAVVAAAWAGRRLVSRVLPPSRAPRAEPCAPPPVAS